MLGRNRKEGKQWGSFSSFSVVGDIVVGSLADRMPTAKYGPLFFAATSASLYFRKLIDTERPRLQTKTLGIFEHSRLDTF